jgi:acetyl esterase/lipase
MGRRLRLAALAATATVVASLLTGCTLATPTYDNVKTSAPPFQTAADGDPRAVDIYMPSGAPPSGGFPVLLWITGAWSGDEKLYTDVGIVRPAHFTDEGFVVIGTRYTNLGGADDEATDADWPEQVYDVDTAIRWLRGYHDTLGIDPARILVIGHSAGAQLAASVATNEFQDPDPTLPDAVRNVTSARPDGLVLLAGPYELSRGQDFPDPLAQGLIRDMLGCDPWTPSYPGTCTTAQVDSASPITHTAALVGFPRTLIYAAGDDTVVKQDQGIRFAYGLCATQTDETVWYLPATGAHGAENLPARTIDLFLRHWNSDIPPPDPATDPAPPSPNGVCP